MTDANQAKPSGPDPQTSNNACRVALDLIGRDISPVPVPKGEKNPNRKKWQLLRITAADVPKFFGKDSPNVGALMGLASGGLTDMDLDCKEAVQLAPYFLPRTGSIYGRPSKKRSHYLYTCFDPDPKAGIKFKDELGGSSSSFEWVAAARAPNRSCLEASTHPANSTSGTRTTRGGR